MNADSFTGIYREIAQAISTEVAMEMNPCDKSKQRLMIDCKSKTIDERVESAYLTMQLSKLIEENATKNTRSGANIDFINGVCFVIAKCKKAYLFGKDVFQSIQSR